MNNVLLVVACATILLGTLYPLLMDGLGLGKISVGPPYFSAVFVPLMLPLLLVLGIGPLTRWKKDRGPALVRRLAPAFGAAVVLGAVAAAVAAWPPSVMVALSLALAVWIVYTTGQGIRARLENKQDRWRGIAGLPRAFVGMSVAHTGLAVFVVGVTLASAYSTERDVRLYPGGTETIAGYGFRFDGVTTVPGPNYTAERGTVVVSRDGKTVATLLPEKRAYPIQAQPMTEASIHPGLTRDLYVALGDPVGDGAWTLRLYHKPFVRWIWLGPLLMALGGLLAASDRRYRARVRAPADPDPTPAPGAPSREAAA